MTSSGNGDEPHAPLEGYQIIDLSSGVAGAYCTKILADGGAEVIKLEPPEGDPLRSRSASGAVIAPDDDGALFDFLACSKHGVVIEPDRPDDLEFAVRLIAGADAVVWSGGTRLADHRALNPRALRRSQPHLTVTSITAFGLDSPWSDRPATEFTLQAWSGGIIGLGRGWADRAPISVGGQPGEWLAGIYGALGTMVSRLRAGGGAPGELVDVSMLEAMASCMTYHPVTFFDMAAQPFRTERAVLTPGVHAAKDGLVGVGVGTGQQWLDFCAMVDHPEWMDDPSLFVERRHLASDIDEWMGQRTVDEILELASLFRIPHAPVGNGASVPHTSHFEQRRSLVTNPRDGFAQPDQPFRLHPAVLRQPQAAPRLGEHTERYRGCHRRQPERREPTTVAGSVQLPLSGLRVLDMTAFWAGPLCTHVLGLLGAEIIHVESVSRPDHTRLAAARVLPDNTTQVWERSGIFSGLNSNKKSLTLDLRAEQGREALKRLLSTCDVVVENYTPRVLDQLGLDYDAVRAIQPDIVMVRMPGFGLDGPWRDNAAFAFVIEDASGLTWRTGFPDEKPISPYCLADPNAGIHAVTGLLMGLEHRRRTGESVLVEAAMVDAALNVAAEQIVEYSSYGVVLERSGNRGPFAAPQNLYRTDDLDEQGRRDCWVAIAVVTDDQWIALRTVLGEPDWAMDATLLDASERCAAHDTIDEHLAEWCRNQSADRIVERLWSAGVPVGKVLQPHHQADLAPLQHRGFFETVEHPVTGWARHATLPIRFSRGPRRQIRSPAPLLGEHTREVLAAAGLSEQELDDLAAAGLTGTEPAR